jgi:hypothetical protein
MGQGGARVADGGGGGSIAARADRARRLRFVGREQELAQFESILVDGAGVLFIHGPGGVGKSNLLQTIAERARAAGLVVDAIDGRSMPVSPVAVREALPEALHAVAGGGRRALLIDTYEELLPLDGWLREELLPELPCTAVVVIAGRQPPPAGWTADPGWQSLVSTVALRNFSPEESRRLLGAAEVDAADHERLLQLTHGHPLALSLVVELLRPRGEDASALLPSLGDAPDLVTVLLERFLDDVPTAEQRRALAICAHAKFTTESLLRDLLGDEAATSSFEWLRRLSFVGAAADGLYPHDLARDVIGADVRWRDPDAFRAMHKQVFDHLIRRARSTTGMVQGRAVSEFLFLSRNNPNVASDWDYDVFGYAYPDTYRPSDRAVLLDLATTLESPEVAGLVEHWIDRRPDCFLIVRGEGGAVLGSSLILPLHETTDEDRAADPAVRTLWEWAQRHHPPRAGEPVTAWLYGLDVMRKGLGSPTFTLGTIRYVQQHLADPAAGWEFMIYRPLEHWKAAMAYNGFDHVPDAGFELGGRTYSVFAHDWRVLPIDPYLDLMADRMLGFRVEAPVHDERAPVLVLSEPEFGAAVREALRDLGQPGRLAANPLLRSRLVRDRTADGDGSSTLVGLIRDAAESLQAAPKSAKYFEAVDRTYLRPAGTQEKAAEVLHLSFSTYRRYLGRGVDEIVGRLWAQELG